MSRIGKLPISLPECVKVSIGADGIVEVQGVRGLLRQAIDPAIQVQVCDGMVTLRPVQANPTKKHRALHGLYRALLYNMVVGVHSGFKRTLELVGVGYKAAIQENLLELSLGYAHDIIIALPAEVKVTTELPKGKNPLIHLECIDKQLLGQIAAKIRSLRKVEPYKGKGVRFLGEQVRRKLGKSTKK